MGRKCVWPPRVHVDSGRSRLRWKGRWHTLGPPGSKQARERYLELVGLIERHGDVPPDAPAELTVAELLTWWRRRLPEIYAPTSREPKEHRIVAKVLAEHYGTLPAAELGPKRLRALLAEFVRRGWSRGVCNRRLVRVKTLLRHAAEEELIPGEVYAAARSVRGLAKGAPGVREGKGRGVATWPEVERVAARCPANVAAMLRLQWHTGMRSCEVRLLRPCDLDRSGDVWLYVPETNKNAHRGQSRVVPFGAQAQAEVAPWLLRCPDPAARVFRPEQSGRHARKPMYTDSAYALAVRRAADAAGLPHLTPYWCRHGYKRRALEASDRQTAMDAMGQRTARAFDHYGGGPQLTPAVLDLARKIS